MLRRLKIVFLLLSFGFWTLIICLSLVVLSEFMSTVKEMLSFLIIWSMNTGRLGYILCD